ncbi:MAG: hypothetical protein KKE17_12180 [Proteobacteria bacterium]|nr:hypothetical protein [Pseudomonadota bacterium]MBU1710755.1 hypothetical protein [Pseudomonadota bacterium]
MFRTYQVELGFDEWEAGTRIAPFTLNDITVAPIWKNQRISELIPV